MAEEDHTVYNEEDIDDEEDDDEEYDLNPSHHTAAAAAAAGVPTTNPSQQGVVVDEDDDDVDVDDDDVDDSTSSSNPATADTDPSLHHLPTPLPPLPSVTSSAAEVTIALPSDLSLQPDPKRHRINDVTVAAVSTVASVIVEEKKPVPLDEQRRLFQRLWTDEDEIELLQGFLEYTASRGAINSSHHHDTTAFYDQIKSKLQLDFNKNQLVEKLRRLKKKYRNVMNKIGTGKDYVFKSAHDQATFEISRKIWNGGGGSAPRGGVAAEEGGYDDEDANPNFNVHLIDQSPNPNGGVDMNSFDKKTPRPRKRSRGGAVKIEEKQFGFNGVPNLQFNSQQHNVVQNASVGVATPIATPMATPIGTGSAPAPVTNLIEETVKSCLSPIFKELLHSVMNLNGPIGSSRGLGLGFAFSPMPLGLTGDLVADEKWRKQQMLELEVYSKRLELVQDQIKAQLEELRSMDS